MHETIKHGHGDWVDRGRHQLETISLIFALKLMYPHKVFLNRGNHEDSAVNRHMGESGFYHAVRNEWPEGRGIKLYQKINETFAWLPMATVAGRAIFICHGGIGDGDWELDDVRYTERPLRSRDLAEDPVLYNLLWSDPTHEDGRRSFGVHSSPRDDHEGLISTFGQDVTEAFLKRNKLGMVIRSHEAFEYGSGYELMHDGKLMRVFSARDYGCEMNDAAILVIEAFPAVKQLVVRPQLLHSIQKPRKKVTEPDL